MTIQIHQIFTSGGGVPKQPVETAEVTPDGLRGDDQQDQRNHGGRERAVSLYSLEVIAALQAEGHPIIPGSTGENLTLAGLDRAAWEGLRPGSRLKIGEQVELEITRDMSPCKKIGGSFLNENFTRISEKVHPGWSRMAAKVLTPGPIKAGDTVEVKF
jgi:MOSC domain-containing protein YiiM